MGQHGTVRAAKSITVNGGSIGGKQLANSSVNLPIVSVPSGAKNLPLGAKSPGSLTINSSKTSITLAPGSYVVSNLTVSSPGAISISPQGKVQIWVTGSLSLGGNENLNGVPTNLDFLVTSSGTVNVNSGGQLFGRIYAPGAPVNLKSPVFGSVVGSSVTLNSGSAVHFAVQPRAISTVVNSTLYPKITSAFETYCQDLENEGYMVMVRTMASTPPASDLRKVLIADHTDYSIEGAFLIGNLPYALYSDGTYTRFAVEYYFMDLTGTWTDANSDGVLDGHSDPDHGPEIYIGRLRADNMGLTETDLVNSYFQRNHTYRTTGSSLPQRAMSFNAMLLNRSQRLEAVYDNTPVAEHSNPSGNDFLQLLGSQQAELLHVISDSGPTTHTFATPTPTDSTPSPDPKNPHAGTINSSDIAGVSKAYHFFLLHACSAEDFTTPNNLASTYLLVKSQGLATFGVTRTTHAYYFDNYFASNFLAMDQTLGMALFHHDTLFANDNLNAGDGYNAAEGEFYILGDPTLRLNSKSGTDLPGDEFSFNNDFQYSRGSADSLGTIATYGAYYDLVYFTTLGSAEEAKNSGWINYQNRGFGDYNDDLEATLQANDFVLFTFDGMEVEYFAEVAPDHGQMDVFVDSVFQQTVNLQSATRMARQAVFYTSWAQSGRHSIMLVNKIQGAYGVADFFWVGK